MDQSIIRKSRHSKLSPARDENSVNVFIAQECYLFYRSIVALNSKHGSKCEFKSRHI